MSTNGANTITGASRVTLGFLITCLSVILLVGGWGAGVWVKANGALSREDAQGTYLSRAEYQLDQTETNRRLIRIEDKLDKALERR